MFSAAMEKKSQKTVLACFGERKREVTFSSDAEELQPLLAAVKAAYNDVIKVNGELIMQLKSEDWGGEFVDLHKGSTIPNRSVVKVIAVNEVS